MKNILKYSLLILIGTIMVSSCDSDEPNNPADIAGECMDFVQVGRDNGKLIYLDFIDETNGWAIELNSDASHDLLNTSDGGVTWQLVNENFEMDFDNGYVSGEAVKFINATNGFKLVEDYNSNVLKIQYTTDKGATWNTYTNPFVVGGNSVSVNWWNETFVSNGTETLFFGKSYYNVFVLKVDNAMNITYSQMYDINSFSVNLEDSSAGTYHYAANGTITAIVTETSNTSGDNKIAQSTDNGATWTITSDVLDGEYFISSSWVNDSIGYVAVGYYSGAKNIYKTTDGGATWTVLNEPPNFQMIRFADENNGIGVTDFDFYYTTDGAATWTEIETCKNSDGYAIMGYDEVIAYPSVNNGWVAGSRYHEDFVGSDTGVFNFTGE